VSDTTNNGKQVLIADDSRLQRLVLSRRLEHLGFRVVQATDGADALSKIELQPPDAVITDVQMEPMDGIELCRRLKSDQRLAHIPVVVTSVSDPGSENDSLSRTAGASAYAIRTSDLEAVVGALLRALE